MLESDDASEANFLSSAIATTSIEIQEEKRNVITVANKGKEVSRFTEVFFIF